MRKERKQRSSNAAASSLTKEWSLERKEKGKGLSITERMRVQVNREEDEKKEEE